MDDAGLTGPDLTTAGPLSRDAARSLLDAAAELMAAGDYADAALRYRRVIGFDEAALTGAALLGLGEALYRLDDDPGAVATWEAVLELPDNPSTYAAWRNVAAARVRDGDLSGAIAAYREADRRAPAADRPEIASRLGWLAKETGNPRAAGRYFARARGSGPAVPIPYLIMGLTIAISLTAMLSADGDAIFELLWLDKFAVAEGEYWRLWTVTLLHDPSNFLHLGFNMYALYLTGPLVERLYGSRLFVVFYLLFAASGSIASYVFSDAPFGIGASGAIFGLIGLLFAASRTHHPVIDRQGRMLIGQLGFLILVNLGIGFAFGGYIDNAAHIGGLLAGLWLGFLIVPGRVTTLRSLWQRPADSTAGPAERLLPMVGVVVLVGVLVGGAAIGTETWQNGGPARAGSAPIVEPVVAPLAALPSSASRFAAGG